MRVLIVSVTTGGGHNASARAVESQFKEMDGVEPIVVDMYEYCSRFVYKALDRGYILATHYLPRQFGYTYNSLDEHAAFRKFMSLFSRNRTMAKKFSDFFNSYEPDVIITTHVLSALVLNVLKTRGRITVPVIGIVTDYCIHPYWEDCGAIEYIVTASEKINLSAVKKNIALSRLLPYGIPVMPKFAIKMPKAAAREKLALPAEGKIALVMSGSMGYGNVFQTVKEILRADTSVNVVCVCGNNGKLYNALTALNNERLRVHGFIDNVSEYMDAADCIVTKPGGLTTTELLVKNLPAIILDPIPGPEEHNMRFLLKCGGAVKPGSGSSIARAVNHVFKIPGKLASMEEALKQASRPDAAARICELAVKLHENSGIIGIAGKKVNTPLDNGVDCDTIVANSE